MRTPGEILTDIREKVFPAPSQESFAKPYLRVGRSTLQGWERGEVPVTHRALTNLRDTYRALLTRRPRANDPCSPLGPEQLARLGALLAELDTALGFSAPAATPTTPPSPAPEPTKTPEFVEELRRTMEDIQRAKGAAQRAKEEVERQMAETLRRTEQAAQRAEEEAQHAKQLLAAEEARRTEEARQRQEAERQAAAEAQRANEVRLAEQRRFRRLVLTVVVSSAALSSVGGGSAVLIIQAARAHSNPTPPTAQASSSQRREDINEANDSPQSEDVASSGLDGGTELPRLIFQTLPIPNQPFPGQLAAPCPASADEFNGYCWTKWVLTPAQIKDGVCDTGRLYEPSEGWCRAHGAGYRPVFGTHKPHNAVDPQ